MEKIPYILENYPMSGCHGAHQQRAGFDFSASGSVLATVESAARRSRSATDRKQPLSCANIPTATETVFVSITYYSFKCDTISKSAFK